MASESPLPKIGEGIVLDSDLVINLAAATELILKAQLYKEDWSLIFESRDKATYEALNSGDFTSVHFDTCVKRLEKIKGIRPLSEENRKNLYELRKHRNRYEHLRLTPNFYEVLPLAAACLDAVLDIVADWFEATDLDAEANKMLEELRFRITTFKDLHERRLKRLAKQLKPLEENGRIARCPICYQETLELGSKTHLSAIFKVACGIIRKTRSCARIPAVPWKTSGLCSWLL